MKNEIIFSMGMPAAGKSTIINAKYGASHKIIDCDKFKVLHPDYDPKKPELVHAWSSNECAKAFEAAIDSGLGCYVIDGTGSNAEKLVYQIRRARRAGFVTRLVYVQCSLETSLQRNARRERTVPESVILDKAQLIQTSFDIVSQYVDLIEIIDNDAEKTLDK